MQYGTSALKLQSLLADRGSAAMQLLLQRGESGQLMAKAGCLRRTRNGRSPGQQTDVVLKKADWRAIAKSAALPQLLRGDPVSVTDDDGNQLEVFGGVMFCCDHVGQLLELAPPVETEGQRRNKGGRPPKIEERDKAWLALVEIALEGHLDTKDLYPTRESMCREVAVRIGSSLGETIIEELVRKIWNKFIVPPLDTRHIQQKQ